MHYSELMKSVHRFLHPPLPTIAGLTPDIAITNTFRLPDMEDLQLFVVWNSDCADFTESLIFRIVDENTKLYLCSLRRMSSETISDLVKRTVDMALQKKDCKTPPEVQPIVRATPMKRFLKSLLP